MKKNKLLGVLILLLAIVSCNSPAPEVTPIKVVVDSTAIYSPSDKDTLEVLHGGQIDTTVKPKDPVIPKKKDSVVVIPKPKDTVVVTPKPKDTVVAVKDHNPVKNMDLDTTDFSVVDMYKIKDLTIQYPRYLIDGKSDTFKALTPVVLSGDTTGYVVYGKKIDVYYQDSTLIGFKKKLSDPKTKFTYDSVKKNWRLRSVVDSFLNRK